MNKSCCGDLGDAERCRRTGTEKKRCCHREADTDDHWRWRQHMAEEIAALMDAERFGVKAVYLIGSTKNVNAGPQSDIDLIIHFGEQEAAGIADDVARWLELRSERDEFPQNRRQNIRPA